MTINAAGGVFRPCPSIHARHLPGSVKIIDRPVSNMALALLLCAVRKC